MKFGNLRSIRSAKNLVGVALSVALAATGAAQQAAPAAKAPSQVRINDFPSVRGYDPGYPIPYDPKDR